MINQVNTYPAAGHSAKAAVSQEAYDGTAE